MRIATGAVAQAPATADADEIVAEAFLFLYPLVIVDVTRRYQTTRLPRPVRQRANVGRYNEFIHYRAYPAGDDKTIVRVNFDTLYSIAHGDLTQGPIDLEVPDGKGRYYLLPMLDYWTDVFAVPGSRASGNGRTGRRLFTPAGFHEGSTKPVPDWTKVSHL
jgi:hypothetical protein